MLCNNYIFHYVKNVMGLKTNNIL